MSANGVPCDETDAPAQRVSRDLRRFANVEAWVFDLDNTLYPFECDLWPRIDARITVFMSNLLGLDGLSARALQKYYYRRYGTTLRGLMEEHSISAEEFLDFVHDVDRSILRPDDVLAAAIDALPGRKLIFTNGSRAHALETARRLGLAHAFEDIFDIVAGDLVPKPAEQTYDRFFERHGVDPTRAAFFEDIAHNLRIPHKRGMATVLLVPRRGQVDNREAWEREGSDLSHIDFVTEDLAAILREIATTRSYP